VVLGSTAISIFAAYAPLCKANLNIRKVLVLSFRPVAPLRSKAQIKRRGPARGFYLLLPIVTWPLAPQDIDRR
jgi:hypothetical protein